MEASGPPPGPATLFSGTGAEPRALDSPTGRPGNAHGRRSAGAARRFGILVEQRYLSHAQPAGMIAALRARGQDVALIDPDAAAAEVHDDGWLRDLDLVVARGRSRNLLCLLAWAEGRGKATINARAAIARVHDKAEMGIALAGAGIPTPRTFVGRPEALAETVPGDAYPLILKPSFGDNCQGLHIVETPAELGAVEWGEPLVLAQELVPSDGRDLKLYVIGRQVWAVRKPSPLRCRDGPSVLVDPSPAFIDLAQRCGRLFGLELFGVDCLETPAGPVVIEVNEFPNYTAVPDAGRRLAAYALEKSRAQVTG